MGCGPSFSNYLAQRSCRKRRIICRCPQMELITDDPRTIPHTLGSRVCNLCVVRAPKMKEHVLLRPRYKLQVPGAAVVQVIKVRAEIALNQTHRLIRAAFI